MRKINGYIFHLNLMTEGQNVEHCILYKILMINILPENGNKWQACEG